MPELLLVLSDPDFQIQISSTLAASFVPRFQTLAPTFRRLLAGKFIDFDPSVEVLLGRKSQNVILVKIYLVTQSHSFQFCSFCWFPRRSRTIAFYLETTFRPKPCRFWCCGLVRSKCQKALFLLTYFVFQTRTSSTVPFPLFLSRSQPTII